MTATNPGYAERWDPEREQVLRDLWPVASTQQIAERIGMSRRAVLGKARRMGLPGKQVSRVRPAAVEQVGADRA